MIEPGRLQPGDTIDYEITKKGFTYALLATQEEDERFVPPMKGQFYDIIPFWDSRPVARFAQNQRTAISILPGGMSHIHPHHRKSPALHFYGQPHAAF